MSDALSATLHIASGLHVGAGCVLPDRPFTIGADFSADIILHDEGIAPIHLVLEPDGNDLRIIVRAVGVLIGDTALEQGETVISALPVSIMLGPVELRCEGPAMNALELADIPDTRPAFRSAAALLPRTPLGRAAGAGLLGVIAAAILAGGVLTGDNTPAHAASQVVLHKDAGIPDPDGLRRMVNAEMAVLGIRNVSLAVEAGIVTATGSADPADGPKIHALELWFDHRFGESAVLLSQVTLATPEQLSVKLQSVWDGPNPNIVVGGQRYDEGSTLPDGSVVQKINDSTVMLLRHGQPYNLQY